MQQLISVGHKTRRRRLLVRQLACVWIGNTHSGEEKSADHTCLDRTQRGKDKLIGLYISIMQERNS